MKKITLLFLALQRVSENYRWNPTKIVWGTANGKPNFTPGTSQALTVTVQNVSTLDWGCDSAKASFKLG